MRAILAQEDRRDAAVRQPDREVGGIRRPREQPHQEESQDRRGRGHRRPRHQPDPGIGWGVNECKWQGWPDQGVPLSTDYEIILQMVNLMLEQLEQQNKIVLHCSAGVGRTGTLISLTNLMIILKFYKDELAKDPKLMEVQEDNFKISIFGVVRRLREQRWGMVHTSEQYSYLYKFMDQTIKDMFNL